MGSFVDRFRRSRVMRGLSRATKMIAFALAGLALLLVPAGAGLVLWARSDAGETWITARVNAMLPAVLEPTGLRVTVDALSGPLPSRLHAAHITVSDSEGVWLTVAEAELIVRWSSLPSALLPFLRTTPDTGVADVPLVRVAGADWRRLPILPDRAAPPEPEVPADPLAALRSLEQLPDWLPALEIRRLALEDIAVGQAVTGEAMVLSLSGEVRASRQGLQGSLQAERTDLPGADQMTLHAALTPQGNLSLRLEAEENRHGLAVRHLPAQTVRNPVLRLALNGSAPLENWRGTLTAELLEASPDTVAEASAAEQPRKGRDEAEDNRPDVTNAGVVAASVSLDMEAAVLHLPRRVRAELNAATGDGAAGLWNLTGQPGGRATFALSMEAAQTAAPLPAEIALTIRAGLEDMTWADERLTSLLGGAATLDARAEASLDGTEIRLGLSDMILHAAGMSMESQAAVRMPAEAMMALTGPAPGVPESPVVSLSPSVDDAALPRPVVPPSSDGTDALPASSSLLEVLSAATANARLVLTLADLTPLVAAVTPEATDSPARADTPPPAMPLSLVAEIQGSLADPSVNLHLESAGLRLIAALQGANLAETRNSTRENVQQRLPLALRGDVTLEVADWRTVAALSGRKVEGAPFHAAIRLEPEADGQGLEARWTAERLRLDGVSLTVEELAGDVAATLAPGRIDLARLDAAVNLMVPASRQSVREKSPEAANDRKKVVRPADGKVEDAGIRQALGLHLARPATLRYGPSPDLPGGGFTAADVDLKLTPTGRVRLDGLLQPDKLHFKAAVSDVELGALRPLLPALPEGAVRADLNLTGTPARPSGGLSATLTDIRVPGSPVPPLSLRLEGELEHDRHGSTLAAHVDFAESEHSMPVLSEARAEASVPVVFSAQGIPSLPSDGPISARVAWNGDLAPLWSLLPLADKRLTGSARLRAELSGSLQAPRVSLDAALENAAFEDLALGLLLRDIQAAAVLTDAPLAAAASRPAYGGQGAPADVRLSFRAGDGMGGAVTAEGTVSLADFSTPVVDVQARLSDFKPLRRQDLRVSLSGTASVEGPVAGPQVQAAITVNEGELRLAELPGGGIRTLEISDETRQTGRQQDRAGATPGEPAASEPTGSLAVRVILPNRFYVRGHGLESEWRGDIQVGGTFAGPAVTGALNAVRGNFELLNRYFVLDHGVVNFAGGQRMDPLLDIAMAYEAENILAMVVIGGTASRPELTLESQPGLPQDEIISQIMFGQSSGSLGRLEALQLAGAVATLAGIGSGGGLGALDMARGALGVDVLRLNSSNKPGGSDSSGDAMDGASLELGKYVTDRVYVGVSQGMKADSTGVLVEVELTPHLNLEARTDNTRTEGGVEWRYDY